ncbi:endo alpha-1,4 polygalactosaminidase [Kribbella antibiotica]|uniref:endo alpha-1,4 polygalactosaminidase n=1 Tax=Kribbella antibiotica TaxID=190195 RepID=UPI001EDF7641|nr:endo alpha-1,4 polygalactosaminidase [Kribbella antibiotica]
MSTPSKPLRAFAAVALLATAAGCGQATADESDKPDTVATAGTLPPAHAAWDYQIGGPYTPADGVTVVSRDHTVAPATGLYNICYLNAFQAQPDAQSEWGDLLLTDAGGKVVMDVDWGEALLDLRTDEKRRRIAAKINVWIDDCASAGYDAVEPDNYDSFSRSQGLLKPEHATAYIQMLADHAHERKLAIAQKNTLELASQRESLGLDFAVVEECGEYDECGKYVDHFGTAIVVVEYSDEGMATACKTVGDRVSVVRRDRDVSAAGSSGHVYKTC